MKWACACRCILAPVPCIRISGMRRSSSRLIEAERVTFTIGATPFLADTLRASNLAQRDIRSLRHFVCGGAPIPRPLATEAVTRVSCQLVPCWGMTEVGPVTMTHPDDPIERVVTTDGCVYPQMEL